MKIVALLCSRTMHLLCSRTIHWQLLTLNQLIPVRPVQAQVSILLVGRTVRLPQSVRLWVEHKCSSSMCPFCMQHTLTPVWWNLWQISHSCVQFGRGP